MTSQTLQQQRAQFALKCLEEVRPEFRNDYASIAKRLPTMILHSGLGQALAYLKAKRNESKATSKLYDHVQLWLKACPACPYGDAEDIILQLMSGSRQNYQKAQIESLQFLNWLRKFAEAFLEQGRIEIDT